MKIGIIGSGNVGGTLGRKWTSAGHDIVHGSNRPNGGASRRPVAEAIDRSEVVVLATPWPAAAEVVTAYPDWDGRILLDCTNPLLPDLSGLAVGGSTSGGEQVAAAARGARAVKIFNTTGANVMENPEFGGEAPAMFYCGDDDDAKAVGARLAAEIGFRPVDAGPMTQARLLEPMALLWITMALRHGYGREIAFQLLRR